MNVQNVHYILSFENFYMHLSLISLAWFLPSRYYVIYKYPVTLKCALPLPSITDAEIQHHPTPTGHVTSQGSGISGWMQNPMGSLIHNQLDLACEILRTQQSRCTVVSHVYLFHNTTFICCRVEHDRKGGRKDCRSPFRRFFDIL